LNENRESRVESREARVESREARTDLPVVASSADREPRVESREQGLVGLEVERIQFLQSNLIGKSQRPQMPKC